MEFIPAKTIIQLKKDHSWFGTDFNMNIYKGCCHDCIYCDSRSECYGVDQFSQVRAKEDSLMKIRDELRRKTKKGVIGTGAMSDPYNPHEKELLLTRHALELINAFEFGISIATKSSLITRDIDLLTCIKEHSPVICKITITTTDDKTAKIIEPNAPSSSERFAALKQLSDNGIFAGILLMPVLPFITDSEENIRQIVQKAYECGAKFIYASFGVTLRDRQRTYFYDQIDKHYPGVKELYKKAYGERYSCGSKNAKKLYSLFTTECIKHGILFRMEDIVAVYKRPYHYEQLSLFHDLN